MGQVLLLTDHLERSRRLARDLGSGPPCDLRDLYDDVSASERASVIVADVLELSSGAIERLRRFHARAPHGTALILLLHYDSQRARLMSVALGATQTLTAPFDLAHLRKLVGAPPLEPAVANAEPLADKAIRTTTQARSFLASVFVSNRPITPAAIDIGTDFIGEAIRDTGIRDWVRAVRRFDDATHQHCLLVAGLAAAFAASLGLGAFEGHRVTKAALLHDVGKIHIPCAILNKPGKLTDAEMAIMRQHPLTGYDMLACQGFDQEMLRVVRSHHEMLDGSGYPDRLKDADIPDLVRLVTVCDIYAALIERRPYKAPMPGDKAFAILGEMAGRLDPAIVDAFRPVADTFTPIPHPDA